MIAVFGGLVWSIILLVWGTCVAGAALGSVLYMRDSLPGTRGHRRRLDILEQQHRIKMARLIALENKSLDAVTMQLGRGTE